MSIKEVLIRNWRRMYPHQSNVSDEIVYNLVCDNIEKCDSELYEFLRTCEDDECMDIGSEATLRMSKIISKNPGENAFGDDDRCRKLVKLCSYVIGDTLLDDYIKTAYEVIDPSMYYGVSGNTGSSESNPHLNAYREACTERINAIFDVLALMCNSGIEDERFIDAMQEMMLTSDVDLDDGFDTETSLIDDIYKVIDDDDEEEIKEPIKTKAPMLEFGSVATPFIPPNPAEELRKIQSMGIAADSVDKNQAQSIAPSDGLLIKTDPSGNKVEKAIFLKGLRPMNAETSDDMLDIFSVSNLNDTE